MLTALVRGWVQSKREGHRLCKKDGLGILKISTLCVADSLPSCVKHVVSSLKGVVFMCHGVSFLSVTGHMKYLL